MPQAKLGRPATYEDMVDVPEHLIAEIVDGELPLLWDEPSNAEH